MLHKYIKLTALLLLACFFNLQAQTDIPVLSGRVLDVSGMPVDGATVAPLYKLTDRYIADADGKFEIPVSKGEYIQVETPQNQRKIVKVDADMITVVIGKADEIINMGMDVTVPGSESTAAVSMITGDDIMKSSASNPWNALPGLGLGLTVLKTGGAHAASGNPEAYIRGMGSLRNNNLLVIVDGFERNLGALTKEEIENIQVLKDGPATSLYGLKGANGVLLVTTKTGKYNAFELDINYDHSFNYIGRLPKMADGYTYANAMNEALKNDGLDPMYDAMQLEGINSHNPFYGNVNWQDEVLRKNGSTDNVSLVLRGGSKEAKYFAVLDVVNDNGFVGVDNIVKDYSSQYKNSKLNVRTNIDVKLTSTTDFAFKLVGNLSEYNRPTPMAGDLIAMLYNTPAAAFPVKTPYGDWGGSDIWKVNPEAETAARGYSRILSRTLFMDMTINQRLDMVVKGLSVDGRLAYDNFTEYWDNYRMNYSIAIPTVSHPSSETDYKKEGEYSEDITFSRDFNAPQWRRFNVQGRANFNRIWNQHSLDATAGVASEYYIYDGKDHTFKRVNIFTHAHYGFMQKYFADFALSVNGTDLLPPGHHYGAFPSLSAAWLISKESFMSDLTFVDLLKLRASWGLSGSDLTPEANMWMQKYGWTYGYPLGGNYESVSGLSEARLPTKNMTYEKASKWNVGLDISLFNFLDINLEAFKEKRTDILVIPQNLSTVLGASMPYENMGKVDNKGIEIGLNVHKTVGDWTFNGGGNYTFTRNKIIEMGEEYKPYEWMKQTGHPVGQIFGYEAIGFFKDADDIAANPVQMMGSVAPGDIKFKDMNGDEIIDAFDQKAIGNSTIPEIYYSFNLGVEYKGIGIDALFQGTGNYSALLNTPSVFRPLTDYVSISQHYYDNRWTPENQNARYPRLSTGKNENNYSNNTIWIADRSYLKLRHAELYYNFSKKLLSKLPIEKAKIYVRATDFTMYDHIDVMDPEVLRASFPVPTSINIGFSLKF